MHATSKHGLVFLMNQDGTSFRVVCTCNYQSETDSYSRTRRHGRKHLSRMQQKGEKIEHIAPELSVDTTDTIGRAQPISYAQFCELIAQ